MQTEMVKTGQRKIQVIAKSNNLILSHFDFTALEQKLLIASILRLREQYGEHGNILSLQNTENAVTVDMPVKDLKEFFGKTGNGIYSDLRVAADSITSRKIELRDENDKTAFSFEVPFPIASCKDGVFSLTLAPIILKGIANLDEKFSLLQVPAYKNLSNQYAIRLYEMLTSYLYKQNVIVYDLTELKLELGVLVNYQNAGQRKTQNKDKYPRFADFDRFVLKKAIYDVNFSTEITVEYTPKKRSSGRAYDTIEFIVTKKEQSSSRPAKPTKKDKETSVDESAANLWTFLDPEDQDTFTPSDIAVCLILAGNDEEIFMKQYNNYRKAIKSGTVIKNPTGWLISAIRGDYSTDQERKSVFGNFPQRQYSAEEMRTMEEKMLNR